MSSLFWRNLLFDKKRLTSILNDKKNLFLKHLKLLKMKLVTNSSRPGLLLSVIARFIQGSVHSSYSYF